MAALHTEPRVNISILWSVFLSFQNVFLFVFVCAKFLRQDSLLEVCHLSYPSQSYNVLGDLSSRGCLVSRWITLGSLVQGHDTCVSQTSASIERIFTS